MSHPSSISKSAATSLEPILDPVILERSEGSVIRAAYPNQILRSAPG